MNQQPSLPMAAYAIAIVAIGAFITLILDRAAIFALSSLTTQFYLWLLLLGAVALLLGVVNVIAVHLRRIQGGQPGWLYSLTLVAALGAVIVAGVVNPEGAEAPLVELIFNTVILPGQATLFALLVFFMAAAAYRYLRFGRTGGAWMLAGLLLIFALQVPAFNALWPDMLRNAGIWLVDVPVMSVARGALLGGSVALLVASISALARQD